ncbi:TPA: hypothetical protein ACJWOE_001863 [Streptococcus pneumoniae]
MAKVQFTIKNDKGEDVLKKSKEITTRDYRDYLVMNDSLTSDFYFYRHLCSSGR